MFISNPLSLLSAPVGLQRYDLYCRGADLPPKKAVLGAAARPFASIRETDRGVPSSCCFFLVSADAETSNHRLGLRKNIESEASVPSFQMALDARIPVGSSQQAHSVLFGNLLAGTAAMQSIV